MSRAKLAGSGFSLAVLAVIGCYAASLAGLAALAGPSLAQADPPPTYSPPADDATEPDFPAFGNCPAGGLSAYGGSDDAAAELRSLRNELAATCTAFTDREDEIAHRVWWVVDELLHAHDQRALSNGFLSDVKAALTGTLDTSMPGVTVKDPLPVSDATAQQYSDNVASAVDGSGSALKGALWFIAGIAAASLAAYAIYRVVMPRA